MCFRVWMSSEGSATDEQRRIRNGSRQRGIGCGRQDGKPKAAPAGRRRLAASQSLAENIFFQRNRTKEKEGEGAVPVLFRNLKKNRAKRPRNLQKVEPGTPAGAAENVQGTFTD